MLAPPRRAIRRSNRRSRLGSPRPASPSTRSKVVMGRREVRSVDRLLVPHRTLAAQRRIAAQVDGLVFGSASVRRS